MVGEDVLQVYKKRKKKKKLSKKNFIQYFFLPAKKTTIILTTIISGQTVKGVIRLGFTTNETAESVGGVGTGQTTFSIDITNVDLDGSVVLGSDETVGGRAVIF